ncbi:hypothetical protein P5V15_010325 [Pogonomyrmex californicus]
MKYDIVDLRDCEALDETATTITALLSSREGLKYLSQEEVGWRKKEERQGAELQGVIPRPELPASHVATVEDDHNRKTARRSRYKLASSSRFTTVPYIEDRS